MMSILYSGKNLLPQNFIRVMVIFGYFLLFFVIFCYFLFFFLNVLLHVAIVEPKLLVNFPG